MISIIVPIYKGQQYISRLISMAYRNSEKLKAWGESIELLLVNDYPSDKLEITEKVAGICVRCLENVQNLGIHASKVRGLNAAQGDTVLFLDQDDTIADYYLCSQLEKMGNNTAVFCNGIWRNGEFIFGDSYKADNSFQNYLKTGYPLVSLGQLLIKKEAIPREWMEITLERNGWDDHYLWACLIYQGTEISYNAEMLYIHEEDGSNESFNWNGMIQSGLEFKRKFLSTHAMTKDEVKYYERLIDKKIDKYEKYCYLEKIWNSADWNRIYELFSDSKKLTIAIYGLGIFGKKLLKRLLSMEIDVVYGIDCNANNKHLDIPVYFEEQDNPNVDLIICATGFDDNNIKNKIKTKTITLVELLDWLNPKV